jgi:type II secretory pathway predicted ATPase ExeA
MKMPHQADVERPFPGVPVWQRYVGIGPIEEARQKLCRMINRGEAIGVVMGPPGTGKTLLCLKIASLHRQSHEVVMLGDIRVTSRMGLIQQVLFQLGQPHLGKDEDALHLSLVQTLAKSTGASRPLLLIIDEAQMLTPELLDEVRMMSNIVRDGRPMVQTLLVGGPRLEDALADPQAESLTQRIAVRCYLHPLTHGEVDQYVRTSMASLRLKVDDQAIAAVHHASGGIPRLINQLMDLAIEVASTKRASTVDEMCVQIAWSELQQLPSPILETELKRRGSSIEFGDLDGATFDFENEKIEPASANRSTATSIESPSATIPSHGAGDPQTPEAQPESPYADIAAILQSPSIDCFSPSTDTMALGIWAESTTTLPSKPRSAHGKATPSEIVPAADRGAIAMHRNDSAPAVLNPVFGSDFDEELPIDIHAVPFSSLDHDSAFEGTSLHDQIVGLAKEARDATTGAAVARVDQPHTAPRLASTNPSCDVPGPLADALAVVWDEDDIDCDAIDDRDLLVIEEDVSVMIDTPESSFVASAAMRKPTLKVVQNYQNLFSRLRGQ